MSIKPSLDHVIALVREIYETSSDAYIEISVSTEEKNSGFLKYSHYKKIRKEPELFALHHSLQPNSSFELLCQRHGIQAEYSDGCC